MVFLIGVLLLVALYATGCAMVFKQRLGDAERRELNTWLDNLRLQNENQGHVTTIVMLLDEMEKVR